MTPRTFIASASSIIISGGVPIFADVDMDSQNISPSSIKKVITKNKSNYMRPFSWLALRDGRNNENCKRTPTICH